MAIETKLVNHVQLNGKNYATCKIKFRMALIRNRLWNIVNPTEFFFKFRTDANLDTKYMRKNHVLVTVVL